MAKSQHVYLDEVVSYFDELEDPRSTINQKHPLVSVVVIAMMAVLAGAGGPTAIARWAKLKADFLVKVLKLPNGMPRKDVFRRVLSLLKPDAFQRCFTSWLQSLREKAAEETRVEQPILAVDGKTARRSHDRKKELGALHSVSVWAISAMAMAVRGRTFSDRIPLSRSTQSMSAAPCLRPWPATQAPSPAACVSTRSRPVRAAQPFVRPHRDPLFSIA